MLIGLALSLGYFEPFLKTEVTSANLKTEGNLSLLTETLNER